jgi:hypothetical protein
VRLLFRAADFFGGTKNYWPFQNWQNLAGYIIQVDLPNIQNFLSLYDKYPNNKKKKIINGMLFYVLKCDNIQKLSDWMQVILFVMFILVYKKFFFYLYKKSIFEKCIYRYLSHQCIYYTIQGGHTVSYEVSAKVIIWI